MIAIDSSVWIIVWRGVQTPASLWLTENASTARIVTLDLVLFELLQGARDDSHAARLNEVLCAFPVHETLGAEAARSAASRCRALRAVGVTPRSFTDVVIASWCVTNNAALLQDNRDYGLIATHLGLRLA